MNQFVPHLSNFLDKKGIDHTIYIVHQRDEFLFNRGLMKNIGAKQAFDDGCDYIVWHDIDMIPEDDTCDYSYPGETPKHIAVQISQSDYQLKYQEYFGGAVLFTKEQVEKTNGYSNGLITTKNMKALFSNSHSFISKSLRQKVFILDEYFDFKNELLTSEIFDIVQKKLDKKTLNNLNISSFHFVLRNINEFFVKNIFSWAKNSNIDDINQKFYSIAQDVKNNTKKILIESNLKERIFFCNKNDFSEKLFDLKIPVMNNINSNQHYDNLLLTELKKYDVTKEEFDLWKKTLFVLD